MVNSSRLYLSASGYASHGFPVFPCCFPSNGRCGCGNNHTGRNVGKAPYFVKGLTEHGLLDATLDKMLVKEYWARLPMANIGIAIPEDYIVVDIDVFHHGFESLEKLQNDLDLTLPDTLRITTGSGGCHLWYKTPIIISNTVQLSGYNGIDIRGQGGYVIAPPSLHLSGHRYEVAEAFKIIDAPAQIIELCTKPTIPVSPLATAGTGIITEGSRDNTLASMAGTMRARGFTQSAIEAALRETNLMQCQPPLPDKDVVKIARSYARYPQGQPTLTKIREVF